MRKIATVIRNPNTKRIMLYATEAGYYLFLYNQSQDSACYADYFFDQLEELLEHCLTEYGVTQSHWQVIPDPEEGCQHDRIADVRQ